MSIPLVSVVVTSYNQKDILSRAIDSVLAQTYDNIQIVIADDGSNDGSQDLINQYFQRFSHKIKLVLSLENQGISKNKNRGFKACDGDFITYLDGDDFYFPEKIDREIQVFEADNSLGVVYSNFAFANEKGEVEKYWKQESVSVPQGYIFEEVFSRNFPHSTLYRNELIKADVLKSINYYDESVAAYHDWDSRIRMTRNIKVAYSDYIGAAYVNDSRGISRVEKKDRLLKEMRCVIAKNRHLLKDLSFSKKFQILRSLDVKLIPQEINICSYHYRIWLLLKYLAITGDFKYFTKVLYRYFTKKLVK